MIFTDPPHGHVVMCRNNHDFPHRKPGQTCRICGCVMHCMDCGGATTCPADKDLLPPTEEDIAYLPPGTEAPEGWKITHWKKDHQIAVRRVRPDGARMFLVGTAQSARIYVHFGFRPKWVGCCTYLAYLRR